MPCLCVYPVSLVYLIGLCFSLLAGKRAIIPVLRVLWRTSTAGSKVPIDSLNKIFIGMQLCSMPVIAFSGFWLPRKATDKRAKKYWTSWKDGFIGHLHSLVLTSRWGENSYQKTMDGVLWSFDDSDFFVRHRHFYSSINVFVVSAL